MVEVEVKGKKPFRLIFSLGSTYRDWTRLRYVPPMYHSLSYLWVLNKHLELSMDWIPRDERVLPAILANRQNGDLNVSFRIQTNP